MARPRRRRRAADNDPAKLTHRIGRHSKSSMLEDRLGDPAFRAERRPIAESWLSMCFRAIGADARTPARQGFCLELRETNYRDDEPRQTSVQMNLEMEDAIILRNFLNRYLGQ